MLDRGERCGSVPGSRASRAGTADNWGGRLTCLVEKVKHNISGFFWVAEVEVAGQRQWGGESSHGGLSIDLLVSCATFLAWRA